MDTKIARRENARSSVGRDLHGCFDDWGVVRRDVRRLELQLGLPGGQLAHRKGRVHHAENRWGPLPGLEGTEIAVFLRRGGGGTDTREAAAIASSFHVRNCAIRANPAGLCAHPVRKHGLPAIRIIIF